MNEETTTPTDTKYFGTFSVESIDGNVVTLKDGRTKKLTNRALEYLIQDEPFDLQDEWTTKVAFEMMAVLSMHGVPSGSYNMIFGKVMGSSTDKFERYIAQSLGIIVPSNDTAQNCIQNNVSIPLIMEALGEDTSGIYG